MVHGIYKSQVQSQSQVKGQSGQIRVRQFKFKLIVIFLVLQLPSSIYGIRDRDNRDSSFQSDYSSSSVSERFGSGSESERSGSGSVVRGGGGGESTTTGSVEDIVRKELVKDQILQRLGLEEKPSVDGGGKISKDQVLEAIHRSKSLHLIHHQSHSNSNSDSKERVLPASHSNSKGGNGRRGKLHKKRNRHNNHNSSSSSSIANSSTDEENEIDVEEEDFEEERDDEDEGGGRGDDSLANYAKTSEIISFPERGHILNGQPLLTFSYAGSNGVVGVGVRIKSSHLWVKVDYRSSIGRHFGRHLLHPRGITLYVFQVSHSNHQNNSSNLNLRSEDVSLSLVLSKNIPLDSLGWQKLDVTSVIQKWYDKVHSNHHRIRHQNHHHHNSNNNLNEDVRKLTLLVDCSGCGYSIQPVIFPERSKNKDGNENVNNDNAGINSKSVMSSDSNSIISNIKNNLNSNSTNPQSKGTTEGEIPFLILETESQPNFKRRRRRTFECTKVAKHCCKQRFYISFKDLGWDDWIIAPRGYFANYCRGNCGGAFRTPDTYQSFHTSVIEEYRRTQTGRELLGDLSPCCSPSKLAPMSIIYFGPELNIIKRDLPNMIVLECSCMGP